MVAVGVTDFEAAPVTVPTPLSIASEAAPVALQVRVAAAPAFTVAGVALKEEITGAAGVTVTVAFAVVFPVLFAAIRV